MTEDRLDVTRQIAASPATVFAVLCDPRGHVTIDSSGMLQSADGQPVRQVGDEFVVHMDREALGDMPMGRYDVTVNITGFEQDSHIEWTVVGGNIPPINHRYGYLLEPSETGTATTAYYDWSRVEGSIRSRFPILDESSLRATLGILARNVE